MPKLSDRTEEVALQLLRIVQNRIQDTSITKKSQLNLAKINSAVDTCST